MVPLARWRCNSGGAIVEAALAGMGLCQLPEFYVRHHVATGRLVPVLADARSAPEPIWAVYPKRRHLQAQIRNFVDLLEDKLTPPLERPTFGAPPSAVSSYLPGTGQPPPLPFRQPHRS